MTMCFGLPVPFLCFTSCCCPWAREPDLLRNKAAGRASARRFPNRRILRDFRRFAASLGQGIGASSGSPVLEAVSPFVGFLFRPAVHRKKRPNWYSHAIGGLSGSATVVTGAVGQRRSMSLVLYRLRYCPAIRKVSGAELYAGRSVDSQFVVRLALQE